MMPPLIRILLSAPPPDGALVTHDGEPFTGVGFWQHADGRVSASHFENGVKGPDYVSFLATAFPAEGGPVRLMVDYERTEGEDYDLVLFEGRPLSGVAVGLCWFEGMPRRNRRHGPPSCGIVGRCDLRIT